jgi:SPX domain protein involved in polyphosphate accumulation
MPYNSSSLSSISPCFMFLITLFLPSSFNFDTQVYLDNLSMELYNGRLDKTPGAIALRHRWYGTGTPELGTYCT